MPATATLDFASDAAEERPSLASSFDDRSSGPASPTSSEIERLHGKGFGAAADSSFASNDAMDIDGSNDVDMAVTSSSASSRSSSPSSCCSSSAPRSSMRGSRSLILTDKPNVRFSEETKQHDGLRDRHAIMDQIVSHYFVQQKECSELDVIGFTSSDSQRLKELCEDLNDLIHRIEDSSMQGRACTPVLPGGGGSATKLCYAHLPYVRILNQVVEASLVRVETFGLDRRILNGDSSRVLMGN